MEGDSWSRFSAASKRHQAAVQPRFDLYLGYEEIDGGDEDSRAEFLCPFCSEDFDIVGLCCHIDDEHPVEANNGRRRRFRKGSSGSHSTFSLLKKDLRGGNLQSLFGVSSFTVAPSNAVPDPLLSSFILNFPVADSSKDVKPESLDDGNLINKTSEEKAGGRTSLIST
ncbi:protein DEHYDRATION-INDUCED 19 [Cocos nucifera]|uniref:Protein DEHYDRATION-INDUCED 19 n=1 Tax=Cocos nucifera TaxID=13894 RepID=A0A8K0HT16_COCNU|nr:protein DEHYDRATION-INDUCED 19 [Cocos nucifera]